MLLVRNFYFYLSVIVLIIALSITLSIVCNKELYVTNRHLLGFSDTTVLTPVQQLGKKIFFDAQLSDPYGKSCASCHSPASGFADPGKNAISPGALETEFGNRNALSAAYSSFAPYFHYDSVEKNYIGGLFWDGRAKTLSEQAMNPLFSHFEMNNGSKKTVVDQVKNSAYKDLFLYVFGPDAFDDNDEAFENILDAIEEYEETQELNPFTSKFDHYLKGFAELTASELKGMQLFNDTAKGNCASCHPSTPDKTTGAVMFTDFTYDNLGVPENPDVIRLHKNYKPDLGLGGFLNNASENGKFKVPTLRNIAITAPYFHNGVFKTLEELVRFYSERDAGKFGHPEVKENVNNEELGNLKLTDQEIEDIVAFMHTLTDGYKYDSDKKY